MNSSDKAEPPVAMALNRAGPDAVLAREAGVPFGPPIGIASAVDPIAEWLSLMEVVQMLCPVWPVRNEPMLGKHWRL